MIMRVWTLSGLCTYYIPFAPCVVVAVAVIVVAAAVVAVVVVFCLWI